MIRFRDVPQAKAAPDKGLSKKPDTDSRARKPDSRAKPKKKAVKAKKGGRRVTAASPGA